MAPKPLTRKVTTRFLLLAAALLIPVAPAAASPAPQPADSSVGASGLPLMSGSDAPKTVQSNVAPAVAGDRVQHSTARSHDVTGDGWPDIIARQPGLNGGSLFVYTHSQKVQGTSTFVSKTLVGTGWDAYNWIGVAEVTGDTDEYETASEKPADLIAGRASDGALLVFPHSGRLNGTSTWLSPVQVGNSWNGLEVILLGDLNADGFDDILGFDDNTGRLYAYFHTGKFVGVGTFRSAVLLHDNDIDGDGNMVDEWNFLTEWSRENPDLAGADLTDGETVAARHLNKYTSGPPWDLNEANIFHISMGQFTHATTYCVFLIDINGDGLDDIVKSQPDGKLMYYPFHGWGASPGLGTPVQIGYGWQNMDLLT
ncbi:hypothetical protein GCM10027569_08440 [Flindersiella endophytica]